jgi:hypothetical protein
LDVRTVPLAHPSGKSRFHDGFLLHLAPQVTTHNTSATDFLDERTGIERDRFDASLNQFAGDPSHHSTR